MFSDDGFAGLSFADFFKNFNKPIVYVYRNARTLVIAYIADSGIMVTDASSVTGRSAVEAITPEDSGFISSVGSTIGRTSVVSIVPEDGIILTDADAKIIRTRVDAILPEPVTIISDAQSIIARTKVEPIELEDGTIITDVAVRIIRTKVTATKTNINSPQTGI